MRILQNLHTAFQSINIKHYLSFIFLIFTINGYANTSNYYHPNLETSYKLGNVRQIGRASILLPVFQKEGQLLYFNAIGMMDNKNNQEGNAGLGYRKILNNNIILGIFGHYDRKSSLNNNIFHQGTLGLELFSESVELRANGYVSFSKIKRLYEKPKKRATLRHTPASIFTGDRHEKLIEAPLHGLDIELGARIGQLPLSIYGGYYYFNRDGAKRVQGPSGRLDIKLNNWLSLGGEVKYDEIRKFQYYVGVDLRFSNDNNKNLSPYSLRSKMTQMPLRDVDVVGILLTKEKKEQRTVKKSVTFAEVTKASDGSVESTKEIDGHKEQTRQPKKIIAPLVKVDQYSKEAARACSARIKAEREEFRQIMADRKIDEERKAARKAAKKEATEV